MNLSTGLKTYFWLSAIAVFVAATLPFAAGDPHTGLFMMLIIAPAIALTTLTVNVVLIVRTPHQPFWKMMLAGLLFLVAISAWRLFGPTELEADTRREKAAFDETSKSYLAALKSGEFVEAERIFMSSIEEKASEFPKEAVCVAAEKATLDGLAFTIDLQRKMRDHLSLRTDEKLCRAIPWAVSNGKLNVARTAIQHGETFDMWALDAVVSEICCAVDKRLTESQRIAFYELAVHHHQVPIELMASMLERAVRQKSLFLAGAIVRGAGGADSLPDKGAGAMVTAGAQGWESIESMMALGIDINVVGENATREKSTGLVEALDTGNADHKMVARMLQRGASVKPPKGRSLLVLALRRCNIPVAALLLERGADPNSTDVTSPTVQPLDLAYECVTDGSDGAPARGLVRSLRRHGANSFP